MSSLQTYISGGTRLDACLPVPRRELQAAMFNDVDSTSRSWSRYWRSAMIYRTRKSSCRIYWQRGFNFGNQPGADSNQRSYSYWIARRPRCPVDCVSLADTRVKIGGGLWGLDPHWKTDNPHCKQQTPGKKARGSGFDPPWEVGPDSCECIHYDIVSFSLFILHAWPYCNCNYSHSLSST